MSKKRKIILVIIIILVLALGSLAVFRLYYSNEKKEVEAPKKIDTIEGYDYTVESRDTKLYKDEFTTLKKNLESDEIDFSEYASSIAKMFIIDLYTIDNKINKNDVGGLEFVHPDAKENYEINVKDTLYKYIADDSFGDRKQELPEVTTITVEDLKESTFKLKDEEVPSYEVSLSWEYKEDLDYDEEALITIVKEDKTLYIVQKEDLKDTEENEQ